MICSEPTRRLEIANIAPDELVGRITDAVAERLGPLIETSSQPQFVDEIEIARITDLSTATVGRLRREGQIPSTKVGNRRLYHVQSVVDSLLAMSGGGLIDE